MLRARRARPCRCSRSCRCARSESRTLSPAVWSCRAPGRLTKGCSALLQRGCGDPIGHGGERRRAITALAVGVEYLELRVSRGPGYDDLSAAIDFRHAAQSFSVRRDILNGPFKRLRNRDRAVLGHERAMDAVALSAPFVLHDDCTRNRCQLPIEAGPMAEHTRERTIECGDGERVLHKR